MVVTGEIGLQRRERDRDGEKRANESDGEIRINEEGRIMIGPAFNKKKYRNTPAKYGKICKTHRERTRRSPHIKEEYERIKESMNV